jgi:hypothetical protein
MHTSQHNSAVELLVPGYSSLNEIPVGLKLESPYIADANLICASRCHLFHPACWAKDKSLGLAMHPW